MIFQLIINDELIKNKKIKTFKKHILCKCKCIFDDRKSNSNQKWNNNECWCEHKNKKRHHV